MVTVQQTLDLALTAEAELQAFTKACTAVKKYVDGSGGQWPKSWDNLAAIDPATDYDSVRLHVEIDFDAKPDDMILVHPDDFLAIQPKVGYYDYGLEIRPILGTLRSHRGLPILQYGVE